jgi:hypothetical protein
MENSLAYEMLKEIKASNKRLFIIAIVEMVVIISMFVGILIYESQFEYVSSETTTQELTSTDSDNISQTIN